MFLPSDRNLREAAQAALLAAAEEKGLVFSGWRMDLIPVSTTGGSDSPTLDNALELLLNTGRPLAQCMMMLVPEAW